MKQIPLLPVGMRMNLGLTEVFKGYDGHKQRVFQLFATYDLADLHL